MLTQCPTDSHFRVGGAAGTGLSVADCPSLSGAVKSNCIASSLMFHMTTKSSAYIENSWAWAADHDLDNANLAQIDIYSGRGKLLLCPLVVAAQKANSRPLQECLLKVKARHGCTAQRPNIACYISTTSTTRQTYLWLWYNYFPYGFEFDWRLTRTSRYRRKAPTTHQHLKLQYPSDLQSAFSPEIQTFRADVRDSLLDALLHGLFLSLGLLMSK